MIFWYYLYLCNQQHYGSSSPVHCLRLFKESLSSAGQHFLQYQQNKQLPFTSNIEHEKDHNIWWWKSKSWLGIGTKMAGLNWLMEVQPSCSWWLDLQWQYKYKKTTKNLQIHFHSKRLNTITKINISINLDNTKVVSVNVHS